MLDNYEAFRYAAAEISISAILSYVTGRMIKIGMANFDLRHREIIPTYSGAVLDLGVDLCDKSEYVIHFCI